MEELLEEIKEFNKNDRNIHGPESGNKLKGSYQFALYELSARMAE